MAEIIKSETAFIESLTAFRFTETLSNGKSAEEAPPSRVDSVMIDGEAIPRFVNEFWTSRQRQASSIHEVSYRACFKPQLPRFFIERLSAPGDRIYDPFTGRGTTIIEAGLLNRQVVANDVNPLSKILSESRFQIPDLEALAARLEEIPLEKGGRSDIDLSMFYHEDTERALEALREYLRERKASGNEDGLDRWIRMVATNRLSGHSPGFFSVYTLPPNQAVSPERQRRINRQRKQTPDYRDVRKLILKKSKQLISRLSEAQAEHLSRNGETALFLSEDARYTTAIADNSIQLTVTSPPFLNVVQYAADNWLRCWFNDIDAEEVAEKITVLTKLEDWQEVMGGVFRELFRITKTGGWVAFEVGEVRNGKINLDEYVVPLGKAAGFHCAGILINEQAFTKTANIWGIHNNRRGTNSNRIVMFSKKEA